MIVPPKNSSPVSAINKQLREAFKEAESLDVDCRKNMLVERCVSGI
jgi:hypothetical protein